MKKTYIILVGIMVLAFPGIVNALEFEECKSEIKVDDEVTLTLKATDDILETDEFEFKTSNTLIATANGKDRLSVVVKGIAPGTVAITAENKADSGKSVVCQINVAANTSNDATLKSLGVDGFTLSPAFASDKEEYTVKVAEDTKKVTITGERNAEKAAVEGLGEFTLDKDNMTATVKVTAEDGSTTKTYTIKFEVEEKVKVKAFTLDEVEITGAEIEPKFNKKTFKYTLKVKDGQTPKVK